MIRYRDPLAYLPSCGSRDPVSRRGKVSCFLVWFFLTVGHSLSCVDRCGFTFILAQSSGYLGFKSVNSLNPLKQALYGDIFF